MPVQQNKRRLGGRGDNVRNQWCRNIGILISSCVIISFLWNSYEIISFFWKLGDNDIATIDSPSRIGTAENGSRNHTRILNYYDCSRIHTLPIVKEVGRGKQKTVFEVVLPTGEHVAAKRCSHLNCEKEKLILYEELFYRKLYHEFDTSALTYYGFCSFNLGDPKLFDPKNLTKGSTLLIELGRPVLEKWDKWTSKEEDIRPSSKEDIESLRNIARQYDLFPGGPLLMSGDNIYPHQYMRNKAGQLCHIDFDMVEQMPPPVKSTLEKNCAVMLGGFTRLKKSDPRLNCSSG